MARRPESSRRNTILAASLLVVIGLALVAKIGLEMGAGQNFVSSLVSRLLSTETRRVSIGKIEGLLSSEVTIRDITVADRERPWLTVDRARAVWNPLALFGLEVAIQSLDVDNVVVLAKPISDATSTSDAGGFALPRLPVAVEVANFSVASLTMAEAILGQAARLAVKGSARLGPSQGLGFALDVTRLDRPGVFEARLEFVPAGEKLLLRFHLDEPAGGLVAEVAGFPDRPPVTLDLDGEGTLDAFQSGLQFRAGPAIGAEGNLALDRAGSGRRLVLDLETRLPSLAIGRLQASVDAVPIDAISGRWQFDAKAEAGGLQVGTAALAEAIGTEARLTMLGTGKITGPLDVETLQIEAGTLAAAFKGRLGAEAFEGQLDVAAPDLSRFAKLAGLALRGDATLSSAIEGAPQDGRTSATIDGVVRGLVTGIAAIDGLTGGEARIDGGLSYDAARGFRADDLRLEGRGASAEIDGTSGPESVDLTALLTIPSVAKVDARVSGQGTAALHVTGTRARPQATLDARLVEGALLGRPVPSLVIEAEGAGLPDVFEAQARLDGTIGGKPARGSLEASRSGGGEIRVEPLDFTIGSVAVTGAGRLDPSFRPSGKLSIRARDLDDLSPLVLERLSGTLDADVTVVRSDAGHDIVVVAKGGKLTGFGTKVETLSADLKATGVPEHPIVSGSVEMRDAQIAGETLSRLRLDSKGTSEASDVTLTATARGIDLDARGRVFPATPLRIELGKLDARRGKTRVGLVGSSSITIEAGGAAIKGLVIAANGGRLSIDGRAGSISDLKVTARALPLSVADLVSPDLGLGGTLDGEAAITGAIAAPMGTYRLRFAKVVAAQTKAAGLPPIEAEITGRLEGTRTDLEANVSAGNAGRINLRGTAPLAARGTLDLAVKGNLDLGIALRGMAAEGRSVTGAMTLDGRVTGSLDAPKASGAAVLSNGTYRDAVHGTQVEGIRARLVARDDRITIENATGTTRNGRPIVVTGEVRLDPAGGFPGQIRIGGSRAEIVRSPLATAVVDLDISIAGPLARSPMISGEVGIETLDISIADQLAAAVRPLKYTKHIDPTPTAILMLALAAAQSRDGGGGAPFDATLDVTVDVPGRIRVVGRGLDVELGGSVKVQGTLAAPKPVGAFHLVRGRMQILSSQLDIARANLTFAGDLSPQLDFMGTTQAGGASIRVAVTGRPSDPQFSFTSSPDYPSDEVLSRLLFGQGSGRLTPTQALALTQAVAIYSGGTGALEGLRRSLGLGDANPSSNPLTNWLGDRVSVGIRTGATPAQTGVGVDISIWKQLKARGTIDARGAASVGIGAETEW